MRPPASSSSSPAQLVCPSSTSGRKESVEADSNQIQLLSQVVQVNNSTNQSALLSSDRAASTIGYQAYEQPQATATSSSCSKSISNHNFYPSASSSNQSTSSLISPQNSLNQLQYSSSSSGYYNPSIAASAPPSSSLCNHCGQNSCKCSTNKTLVDINETQMDPSFQQKLEKERRNSSDKAPLDRQQQVHYHQQPMIHQQQFNHYQEQHFQHQPPSTQLHQRHHQRAISDSTGSSANSSSSSSSSSSSVSSSSSNNSSNDLLTDNQLTYNYDERDEACTASDWTLILEQSQTYSTDCPAQSTEQHSNKSLPFEDSRALSSSTSEQSTMSRVPQTYTSNQESSSGNLVQNRMNSNTSDEIPVNDFNNNAHRMNGSRLLHNQQPQLTTTTSSSSSSSSTSTFSVQNPSHSVQSDSYCNQQSMQESELHHPQFLQHQPPSSSSSFYSECPDTSNYQHYNYELQQSQQQQAGTYEELLTNHSRLLPVQPSQSQSPPSSSMPGTSSIYQPAHQSHMHLQTQQQHLYQPFHNSHKFNQNHVSQQQQHLYLQQQHMYQPQQNLSHHHHQEQEHQNNSPDQPLIAMEQPLHDGYKAHSGDGAHHSQYEHHHQQQQHHHHHLLLQQPAYTNLQQLSTNRENYTSQVSTTSTFYATECQANNESPTDTVNHSMKPTKPLKGRRGRPRKKGLRSKNKVNGKLWEFIRDLLLNERTNPSFIRWERREDGVFKFVQSDKVAKMWGERKQNPKMTYEKLSRAMRYYYKSKVLLPVFGRRLVYKFGPNATGWLPPNEAELLF